MGLYQNLLSLLGLRSGTDDLIDALTPRNVGVDLYGEIVDMNLNTVGGETAVFEVAVYERGTGTKYATTRLEFDVPETGIKLGDVVEHEIEAFLTSHGVTTHDEIPDVIGDAVTVTLEGGNLRVDW